MEVAKRYRVWWVPQVGMPGPRFICDVSSLKEAVLLCQTLAQYDMYQFENHIKPDFCNMGGVEMWDETEDEWVDWYVDDEDDNYWKDPEEYLRWREEHGLSEL